MTHFPFHNLEKRNRHHVSSGPHKPTQDSGDEDCGKREAWRRGSHPLGQPVSGHSWCYTLLSSQATCSLQGGVAGRKGEREACTPGTNK